MRRKQSGEYMVSVQYGTCAEWSDVRCVLECLLRTTGYLARVVTLARLVAQPCGTIGDWGKGDSHGVTLSSGNRNSHT